MPPTYGCSPLDLNRGAIFEDTSGVNFYISSLFDKILNYLLFPIAFRSDHRRHYMSELIQEQRSAIASELATLSSTVTRTKYEHSPHCQLPVLHGILVF